MFCQNNIYIIYGWSIKVKFVNPAKKQFLNMSKCPQTNKNEKLQQITHSDMMKFGNLSILHKVEVWVNIEIIQRQGNIIKSR